MISDKCDRPCIRGALAMIGTSSSVNAFARHMIDATSATAATIAMSAYGFWCDTLSAGFRDADFEAADRRRGRRRLSSLLIRVGRKGWWTMILAPYVAWR